MRKRPSLARRAAVREASPVISATGGGLRLGRIVGWEDGPLVEFPGNTGGPLPARSIAVLDEASARRAMVESRDVVLAFEDERPPQRAIILGLLQPALGSDEPRLEARVDGKRVELTADDEVVLRCGSASITLRANGRVVIRGAYVETRSSGVNRIKGGTVLIN